MRIVTVTVGPTGIRPARTGHPWIFRNAIARRTEQPATDQTVLAALETLEWIHSTPAIVRDAAGAFLGWGVYNAKSRLAVRIVSRDPAEPPSAALIDRSVLAAANRRGALGADARGAVRLLFGEADALPGVVADRFADVIVQTLSGAFAWDNRAVIASALRTAAAAAGVSVRTVVTTRDDELLGRDGVQTAGGAGDEEAVTVEENGLPWLVRPGAGQKTGLFCDQRENRSAVATAARGGAILDLFSYHGGFGLTALAAGATRAVLVDSSADALAHAERNAAAQHVAPDRIAYVHGNCFELARTDAVPGGIASFDSIVIDPPKLAPSKRHLEAGLRAYKDVNLAVFRAARSGATVATFSCSGAVGRDEFRRTLAWAASDAGRTVRVIATLGQPADHPIPLAFPEAEYLKGYLLTVT